MTGAQGKTVEIDLDEDEKLETGARSDAVAIEGTVAGEASANDVVDEDADPADKLPDEATPNADGTVTLRLLYPTSLRMRKDGKERVKDFSELVFHRLNGADQRAIASAREDMLNVVAMARSTKLSTAVMNVLFDKMDAADINNAALVIAHFFGSGRKTGR